MRITLLVVLAALTLIVSGCATGFRAGGRNGGVEAGAAVGPAAPLPVPQVGELPPDPH
jgi:hypothetical protein